MRRVIIFSGAGLDAESGISTFRDSGGLWEQEDINKVCNINNFMSNYVKVNDFYNQRRKQLADVGPNLAHKVIARLCKEFPDQIVNVTTNVSDLLERAGCENVQHLHGNLTKVTPNYGTKYQGEPFDVGYHEVSDELLSGSWYPIKPDVVFFGEIAPEYDKFHDLCDSLTSEDLVLVVGSSDTVVPFGIYAKHGATFYKCQENRPKDIIRINSDVAVENSVYQEECLIAGSYTLQTGKTAVEWFGDEYNIKMIREHLGE